MRLIDADVLVERWKRIASISWNETAVTSWSHAYEEIISEIEEEPTIEAESVRHGEWIDKGYSGDWAWQTDGRGNSWRVFQCSACNEKSKSKSKHCPNCGAKMDGKSPENHKKYQE